MDAAAERTPIKTSTGLAPWKIVEGYDERHRSVTTATKIRDAIRFRPEEVKAMLISGKMVKLPLTRRFRAPDPGGVAHITILSHLDHEQNPGQGLL